jgi:hypothetical protein
MHLREAAGIAYGASFAGGKDSIYFVTKVMESLRFMKVGPHLLTFAYSDRPYGKGEFPDDFAASMPHQSQKQAWEAHQAWIAVDYVKGGVDVELEYSILARICSQLIDSNCAGVYVPREQSFMPNDGSLQAALQHIADSRPWRVM